eukprot:Phypoly_transcript_00531.p1 GENE.Phypoly_transcript_00531~~Phypoly_transcript_00531.p1  ORF type:complete len:1353 (-),score=273.72 Phypoly_transcript_00531:347-4405(-)
MATTPSLFSTSIFFFLLVFAPRPLDGADVDKCTAWTETLSARIDDIDQNTLLYPQVRSLLNGFQSLNPPDRESPDSKWSDLLASQVGALMEARVAAVRKLAQEVERLFAVNAPADKSHMYNSMDSGTWDDRFTSTLSYDTRYQTNVSFTYSTVRSPDYAVAGTDDDVAWSKPLDVVFRDNYNTSKSTFTNQYFASATGYLRAFPGGNWVIQDPPNIPFLPTTRSTHISDNVRMGSPPIEGFNARFTPWYVLAASGPKDVVLVLDTSSSMGNLYEVRKAATLVVDGLTSQDFVNVITFSTTANVASCWQNRLVRATDENKQIILSYLLDLEIANGRTNIEDGLHLGTQLLARSLKLNQTSNCQQLLLLLTDGVTSANRFAINNTVHARLFAYVLTIYTDTSPLQRLACSNNGILVPIPNPSSAFDIMASYYKILAPGRDNASEIWVGPYLNQYTNTGLVLSVVRPCFDRSQSPPILIGVVGVDLPLEQIDALIRNFVAPPSYAFVVNNVGQALVHPLIPTGAAYTEVPHGIDIAELEGLVGNKNFTSVRAELMSGATGTARIEKIVRELRGYTHFEGYVNWDINATYHYTRLSGTDFSVAVVWAALTDRSNLPPMPYPHTRGPVTHVVPDAYHSAQQDVSRTSFAVSAKGYCDPVWFLLADENADFAAKVVSAVDQPYNESCPNDLLQPEARIAIQSTSHTDVVWNDTVNLLHPEVRVRFIATHYSGVMRTFPAKTLSAKFDPTYVPWYRRAMAYSGGLVASIPHMKSDTRDVLAAFDDSTNTLVLTRVLPYATPPPFNGTFLPHIILSQNQILYGVVGLSMEYDYFSNMFLDVFNSTCDYNKLAIGQPGVRCFLIDGSGYLITHPLFLLTLPRQNESYIFIGKDEPLLAQTLINNRILVPDTEDDYSLGTKRVITTYTIQDEALLSQTSARIPYTNGSLLPNEDCLMMGTYFISKVSTSNMYLVVLNVTRNNPCAYAETAITVSPTKAAPCDAPIMSAIPSPCGARPVSFHELEDIRGIQKCKSESKAVILGLLIPLGIGFVILGLIWLLRKRRRIRSMRAGMLVPNAENNEDRNENDNPHHPDDPNLPRLNPENLNAALPNPNPNLVPIPNPNPNPNPNLPFPNLSPHINVNDIPIDDDVSGSNLLHNGNNNPSFVVDPQLHNANPMIPPNAGLRGAFSNASPRNPLPSSLRSSGGTSDTDLRMFNGGVRNMLPSPALRSSGGLSQVASDADLRSSASSASLHASGNMFFNPFNMEGEREVEEELDARSIPMHPISQSAGADLRMATDSSDDEEDEEENEEEEDEEEEEEGSEVSEGSGESGESEARDPDDLFASMAREMGIPLPRTSARP